MVVQIDPDWSSTLVVDDITYAPDCLDRARYAHFLTKYLEVKKKEKSYVLNLNSGWGTGKTYFLMRWKNDLSQHHPVIYIDAWKNDHSKDPLMSVISNIIMELRKLTDKKEGGAFDKIQKMSENFIKAVAPIVVGGVVKKLTGIPIDQISFGGNDSVVSPGDTKEVEPSNTESGSSKDNKLDLAAQKLTTALIAEYEKKSLSISSIKKTLNEWIDAVIGQNSNIDKKLKHPTFIIIDELDRCRPNHAVETLEVIKHIFDIPGVVFIVATDTEQLQHAIKVVYGQEFDAKTYLSRFFDSRFTLPIRPIGQKIFSHCDSSMFERDFLISNGIKVWPQANSNVDNIATVIDAFDIPARNAIQIFERIAAVVRFLNKEDKGIDLIYLATLFCLQLKHEDLYNLVLDEKKYLEYSEYASRYSALVSRSKINIDIFHDEEQGRYVSEDITLAAYYEKIFFNKNPNSGYMATKLRINGEYNDDTALAKYVKGLYDEVKEDVGNKKNDVEFVSMSYCNFRMSNIKKKKYKNLVELAISFD